MSEIDEIDDPGIDEDEVRTDDVTLDPGSNADPEELVSPHISDDIRKLYDVYSYRHAAAILKTSFLDELAQIEQALREFKLTTKEIGTPGGNESEIPKKFSKVLRPLEWKETRIQSDFLIRLIASTKRVKKVTKAHWDKAETRKIENSVCKPPLFSTILK